MIPELFVLALDGLDGNIVLESDYLPSIKSLCDGHEHAVVYSPNCSNPRFPYPHTWPAWTTIWTGKVEGEHKIKMPDREKNDFPVISDQPYITVWEIFERAGHKVNLINMQMTRGLMLRDGNLLYQNGGLSDFFSIAHTVERHLKRLKETYRGSDIIGYYTIALDYWFHHKSPIRKELIFTLMDHIAELCQWYFPTKNFIILSDHGFDPGKRQHTNNAFWFSRRAGKKREGLHLKDIAALLLSHIDYKLANQLGEKVFRKKTVLTEAEKTLLRNQFKRMGY